MNNIFDNAKFGDEFITKDSRALIYHCVNLQDDGSILYQLIDEFNSDPILCDESGVCVNMPLHGDEYDVVDKTLYL